MINASLAVGLKDEKIIAIVLHPGYVVTCMTRFKGALKPEDSVAGLTRVIDSIQSEDSGKFFNYDGTIVPW
jgi:RNA-binding protein with serine-rich domain 1|uniref:Short chain dehydrogenase n=1 Tax=Globisporangium ultimum (strain ATCC 200006 / CBS 805.95 / DAOM BR144) TaxID=431595 RepID=K3XD37_GLOUD